jgi:hypothetical protein
MRREFAYSLIQNGVLQLSPLSAFDEAKLGKEIGDSREGTSIVTGRNILLGPKSPIPRSLQPNIEQGVSIFTRSIVVHKKVENVVIFCTTQKFNKRLMADFGYDTCLAISKPDNFFRSISDRIKDEYKFLGYKSCVYGSRKNDYLIDNASIPVYLLKDTRYSNQLEVRAIWINRENHPIDKPMLVCCENIKKILPNTLRSLRLHEQIRLTVFSLHYYSLPNFHFLLRYQGELYFTML